MRYPGGGWKRLSGPGREWVRLAQRRRVVTVEFAREGTGLGRRSRIAAQLARRAAREAWRYLRGAGAFLPAVRHVRGYGRWLSSGHSCESGMLP